MSSQIIVVEGIHDVARVKEAYPDVSCVITNGSEISEETIKLIKELSLKNEIVIFTDPDYPGERIRKRISEAVPNATQAFLKKSLCISKNHKKVGIEHASVEDIKDSLNKLIRPNKQVTRLKTIDLVELGLTGTPNAEKKRDSISMRLNIGCPNTKSFILRIQMLGITYDELKKLVEELDE